jgi:diguanylate cyclase (GGDEF)-like protein/PAS domain S-box-containing protein
VNQSPLPVALFVVNAQGSIESWNHSGAEIAGFGGHDLRGCPIGRLLAFDDESAAAVPFATGLEAQMTGNLLRLHGPRLPVRITIAPHEGVDSHPASYSVMVVPIASFTQEPPHRYAMLHDLPVADIVEGLPCIFYVIDASRKLVLWNRQLELALEMSSDDIALRPIASFFSPHDQSLVFDNIRLAFDHGQSGHEAELVGQHGKRTTCLFQCVRSTLGGQPCIFGTGLDITMRKENELRLLVRERAMQASVNAIVITCREGNVNRIEYVNPAFERLTGYRLHEIRGSDPRFMNVDGMDLDERRRINAALARNESIHALLRNARKNGDIFWNELRIDPVVSVGGDVTHFIGVLTDVTAARHYERRLHYLAHHDPLTGLANRTLLQERLQLCIDSAMLHEELGALAFLDIDNFKHINESFGHEAGDQVLRSIGDRLRHNLRDDDTVARVGGDEFVMLINQQSGMSDITELIERIRQAVGVPIDANGKELVASASIGVALFPDHGKAAEQVMRAADAAMYHAKALGKNNCQFYTPELGQTVHANLLLEASLTRAMRNDEMFLTYQPKIDLRTGRIVGAEALVRWRRPGQGIIMPATFIDTCEETGLIVPLGDWVLENACAQLADLARRGFTDCGISVNLSARQLRQRNFTELVGDMLARHRIAPGVLELEVTESQLMDQPAKAVATLTALKALGVCLSIDDFGTGYSSLAHLQKFPVDFIKIDRSFLADVTHGNTIITRAIIALGHNLRMKVIAEGVETRDQLDFLRAYECDQMQGFYFSAGVGPEAFASMLANDVRLAH